MDGLYAPTPHLYISVLQLLTFFVRVVVYVVVEAHHRATTNEASALWQLIDQVCGLHPKLVAAKECPEVVAIARLIALAWQQREEYLRRQQVHVEKPMHIGQLEKALERAHTNPAASGQSSYLAMDEFESIDFDLVDWSAWEAGPIM